MVYKLSAILQGHSSDVRVLIKEGLNLVSGSRDCSVKRWVNGSFESIAFCPHYISSLALSSSGKIVVGCHDGNIRVFDYCGNENNDNNQQEVITLEGHSAPVSALLIDENSVLYSGSWDHSIKVWVNWKLLATYLAHEGSICDLALFPQTSILISASADKSIQFWSNGKVNQVLGGHSDAVRSLLMINSSEFLSSSNDETIKHWNSLGELLYTYMGQNSYIYSLALINPSRFVSCGEDGTLRIWNVFGQISETLRIPAISVWDVTVLSNGDIAGGSSDGNIWIFTEETSRVAAHDLLTFYEKKPQLNSTSVLDLSKCSSDSLSVSDALGMSKYYVPNTTIHIFRSLPPNQESLIKKFLEFNSTLHSSSSEFYLDEKLLKNLVSSVLDGSVMVVSQDLEILLKVLSWPSSFVFPALDLLRVLICNPLLGDDSFGSFIETIFSITLSKIQFETHPNSTLALKVLVNMTALPAFKERVLKNLKDILFSLTDPLKGRHNKEQLPLFSLLQNLCLILEVNEKKSQSSLLYAYSFIVFEEVIESESALRLLHSIGNLLRHSDQDKEKYMFFYDKLKKMENVTRKYGEKEKEINDVIQSLLNHYFFN